MQRSEAREGLIKRWDALSGRVLRARRQDRRLFHHIFPVSLSQTRTTIGANMARPYSIGREIRQSPETDPFPTIFPPLFDN